MKMRDAWILGWIYGRVKVEIEAKQERPLNDDVHSCCCRPNAACGRIIDLALRMKLMNYGSQLDRDLEYAYKQLEEIPDPKVTPVSIDARNAWYIGYYHGMGKDPIPAAPGTYNLTNRRREIGMTQAKLAELLGVSQTQVSRWERGKDKIPKGKRMKLDEVLGLEQHEPQE